MKAILHIGMPKTGTSSIQDSLFSADLGKKRYFDWIHANHNTLMIRICNDRTLPVIAAMTEPQLEIELANVSENFQKAVARQGADSFIVSSERLFNYRDDKLCMVRDYLAQFASEIKVIAYLRSPDSYLPSAFQQVVKMGDCSFDLAKLLPRYRASIEAADRVFGPETVEVVCFDPKTFHQGDVVQDFAYRCGITLAPSDVVRSNDSLCVEALALLQAEAQMAGEKPAAPLSGGRPLIAELSLMAGRRFAFDPALVAPLMRRHADETAWAEGRMGRKFPSYVAKADVILGGPQDLAAQLPDAKRLLADLIQRRKAERAPARRLAALQALQATLSD